MTIIHHGTPMTPRDAEWEARFWAKVERRSEGECWIWRAAVNRGGYGRFAVAFGKPQRMATHLMLELHGRPRPSPKRQALHHCDNPTCVNPRHLYWGGYAENARDKMERGRCAPEKRRGRLNGMNTKPEARLVGSKNPSAKLTEEQALSIIADRRSRKEIAAEFGVTTALVGQIKRGTAWKHLTRKEVK